MVGRVEGQLIKQGLHAGIQELLVYGTPLGLFLGAIGVLRQLGLFGSKDLGFRIERTLFVPIDGRFPLPGYDSSDRPDYGRDPRGLQLFALGTKGSTGLEFGWTSWQRANRQLSEGLARERAELLRQSGAAANVAAIDAGRNVTLAAIQANYDAQQLFDRDGGMTFSEQSPARLLNWVGSLGRYAAAAAEFGFVPVQVRTESTRTGKQLQTVDGARAWPLLPSNSPAWPQGVLSVLSALSIDPSTFQANPEQFLPAPAPEPAPLQNTLAPSERAPEQLSVVSAELVPPARVFSPQAPLPPLTMRVLPELPPVAQFLNESASRLTVRGSSVEPSALVAAAPAAAPGNPSAATNGGTVSAALVLATVAGFVLLAGK